MRNYEELFAAVSADMTLDEREEKCHKALKTLNRAIFMRLFVSAVLVWAAIKASGQLWAVGLIILVLLINLGGLLPLVQEWKKRRAEYKAILDEEE